MKRFTLCIMATLFLSLFMPAQGQAAMAIVPTSMAATKTAESEEADALTARLDEIKAMDMSTMTSIEKKQLRKEVRAIKSDLRQIGGGVYISVGALILIILLLVILL